MGAAKASKRGKVRKLLAEIINSNADDTTLQSKEDVKPTQATKVALVKGKAAPSKTASKKAPAKPASSSESDNESDDSVDILEEEDVKPAAAKKQALAHNIKAASAKGRQQRKAVVDDDSD